MSKTESNKSWYVIQDNEQLGPFSTPQLKQMLIKGTVSPDTMLYPARALKVQDLDLISKSKVMMKRASALWMILVATLLIVSFPLFEYYVLFFRPFDKSEGLSNAQYTQMLKTSRVFSKDLHWSWNFSANKSQLWIATNYLQNIPVEIIISSDEEGLIDPSKKIEAYASGILQNKFVYIDRFAFQKGSAWDIGKYTLTIRPRGNPEGFRLSSLLIPQKADFVFKDTLYIGVKNSIEWQDLKEKQEKEHLRLMAEAREGLVLKLETLMSILDKFEKDMTKIVGDRKIQDKLKQWEERYRQNVAPLLTGMVAQQSEYFKTEELRIKDLALEAGDLMMNLAEEMPKIKERHYIVGRVGGLRKRCEEDLNALRN